MIACVHWRSHHPLNHVTEMLNIENISSCNYEIFLWTMVFSVSWAHQDGEPKPVPYTVLFWLFIHSFVAPSSGSTFNQKQANHLSWAICGLGFWCYFRYQRKLILNYSRKLSFSLSASNQCYTLVLKLKLQKWTLGPIHGVFSLFLSQF